MRGRPFPDKVPSAAAKRAQLVFYLLAIGDRDASRLLGMTAADLPRYGVAPKIVEYELAMAQQRLRERADAR